MKPPSFLDKIVAREDAPARAAALPPPVVFTNGVFDVLHCGHATYLAQAHQLSFDAEPSSTPVPVIAMLFCSKA